MVFAGGPGIYKLKLNLTLSHDKVFFPTGRDKNVSYAQFFVYTKKRFIQKKGQPQGAIWAPVGPRRARPRPAKAALGHPQTINIQ